MKHVVVVGAGISGLAVAYRLHRLAPDVAVTVLEQGSRPGGTVWTERRDGFQVEVGPNGFLDTKPTTLSLCRDLNLAEQLVMASAAASKNRYLFLDGRLRMLPNSLGSFVRTDLLSWRGKLSLLAERWRFSRPPDSDESVAAFARRRTSREVADVLADALVTGIHAGDPELLSIRAAFPRVAALEAEYGSVLKGMARAARQRRAEAQAQGQPYQRPGQLWSCQAGLRVLIETLSNTLPQSPVCGVTVRRVERAPAVNQWLVWGEGQDHWRSDSVVLACPAYQQAALLADLDEPLAERLGGIAYNRVAVVALGYRQCDVPMPLDGFGYIAPQRTRRDVLGVQWCSSTYPGRAPEGHVLLRALCGGWHRADVVSWADDRLLAAVREELKQALHLAAPPVFHHIIRWQRAIPQYHLGHLDRVAWIEQRLSLHPGLFVTGNALHGVALNDCTEQGERVAGLVRAYLRQRD